MYIECKTLYNMLCAVDEHLRSQFMLSSLMCCQLHRVYYFKFCIDIEVFHFHCYNFNSNMGSHICDTCILK
jgi:hypothetical protein